MLSDVNYTVTTPCYRVTVLSLERGRLVRGPLVGSVSVGVGILLASSISPISARTRLN